MPWKTPETMELRNEFALKALQTTNFRELCREYGISAKTGYKWKERFLAHGFAGLGDESRRPGSHPASLDEETVCKMVKLKTAHPHWGPRKIRALYERQHKGAGVPSESSFKRVLERSGLTAKRVLRPVTHAPQRLTTGRKAEAPNEIWTVDFKGWWKDREGLRVEPLTIRDEHSRMLLDMRILESSKTGPVRACFERLFEIHGLPGAIRSDNGSPFASSNGLLGLSRLSAWWLALGIGLERSRPAHPQDNGAHERMHRDIRRELQAGRIGRDQAAFDLWREQYNHERPHEALGMKTPGELYRPSERPWKGTPEDLDYGGMETRRVTAVSGTIRYRREHIGISAALGGWSVGLSPRETDDGLLDVWFAELLLGQLDPSTASFRAARPGRTEAGAPEPEPKPEV
jgi:putative transposase